VGHCAFAVICPSSFRLWCVSTRTPFREQRTFGGFTQGWSVLVLSTAPKSRKPPACQPNCQTSTTATCRQVHGVVGMTSAKQTAYLNPAHTLVMSSGYTNKRRQCNPRSKLRSIKPKLKNENRSDRLCPLGEWALQMLCMQSLQGITLQ